MAKSKGDPLEGLNAAEVAVLVGTTEAASQTDEGEQDNQSQAAEGETPQGPPEEEGPFTDLEPESEAGKAEMARLLADYHRKRQGDTRKLRQNEERLKNLGWAEQLQAIEDPQARARVLRIVANEIDGGSSQQTGVTADDGLQELYEAYPGIKVVVEESRATRQGLGELARAIQGLIAQTQDKAVESEVAAMKARYGDEFDEEEVLAIAEKIGTTNLRAAYAYVRELREEQGRGGGRGRRTDEVSRRVASTLLGTSGRGEATAPAQINSLSDAVAQAKRQLGRV